MMDIRKIWAATAAAWLWIMAPQAAAQKSGRNVVLLGEGSRSFLGVGVAEINADRAKELKLKEERGVEITHVEADSPAEKAGLKVRDVVLEYQGQRVEGRDQFVRLVRETPAGRSVKLSVSRDGQPQTLSATIDSRRGRLLESGDMELALPEIRIPDIPRPVLGWRSGTLGIEAESLSSQLAEFFGVKEGVLVRSVSKESAAEKAGIRAGDVIVKVGGEAVKSPSEVTQALRSDKDRRDVPMVLMRDKKEVTVTVQVEAPKTPWRPRGTFTRNRIQL